MTGIFDLGLLHSNSVESLTLDGKYEIPKSYYDKSDVLDLKNIEVKGNVTRLDDNNDKIIFKCTGKMKIIDSVSLEEIWYPFSFEINDNLEEIYTNTEEKLDIFELLWENIVLEVPLNYTEVKDFSKYKGNGWSLKEESNEEKSDNPFSEILKDFGKE